MSPLSVMAMVMLNLTNMQKFQNCSRMCMSFCTTVGHNTAQ